MRDIRLDTSNRHDISCILEQRRRMEKGRIGRVSTSCTGEFTVQVANKKER